MVNLYRSKYFVHQAKDNIEPARMSNGATSTKLRIEHPALPQCAIVGILEQLSPSTSTKGRKLALILHGAFGNKDYLFLKRLALRLPLDSFRFDFRGNGETPSSKRHGKSTFEEDLVDLTVVAEYLTSTHGYIIDLVIGHSRGSSVGMRWVCTTQEGRNISGFVNASGLYSMRKITAAWEKILAQQGYCDWIGGGNLGIRMYAEDLETWANWDTSVVLNRFPPSVDILTLHGLADKIVPPSDAMIYARAFGGRVGSGTHTLNLIEGACHNYRGRLDEVTSVILDWWSAKERGELKTGIWEQQVALESRL